MATAAATVADTCLAAREASLALATLDTATKDAALRGDRRPRWRSARREILEANERDMQAGARATA